MGLDWVLLDWVVLGLLLPCKSVLPDLSHGHTIIISLFFETLHHYYLD